MGSEYPILKEFNRGGYGTIFKVTFEDGETVALKRLDHKDETIRRRFEREVRIMLKLDHPNVVKILKVALDVDPPFFLMPFAECNLHAILSDLRIDETRRINIFKQILDGVQYLHQNQIIHRDLKPQNILIFPGDRVAICDLGLGMMINRDSTVLTAQGEQLGTLSYAAPEQINCDCEATYTADIYTLGKILYTMTSQLPIHPVPNTAVLRGPYAYIINKCLKPIPADRYQTIDELKNDLLTLFIPNDYGDKTPTQEAKEIISDIVDPNQRNQINEHLERLVIIFYSNQEDQDLYTEVFPRLPDFVLSEWVKLYSTEFHEILSQFDNYVSDDLVFDYCDVVANFYRKVFMYTKDFEILELITNRLLIMGASHNRYHVRDTLVGLTSLITSTEIAMVFKNAFERYPGYTVWSFSNIGSLNSFHPIIRTCINTLRRPPVLASPDDDLPF